MKRINTTMDCVMITQLCTVLSAVLTFVAHRLEVGYYPISSDFMYFALVPACIFMIVPYFVWKDRLHNQCADDEQQAVLDITETCRMESQPENWKSMWRHIRALLRSYREDLRFDGKLWSEPKCSCHLDETGLAECQSFGCPTRKTGIYAEVSIGSGDMPDGPDAPVEHYVQP